MSTPVHIKAVFGPPGTGKSTYLTKTVEEYAQRTPNMGVLSFTKAAAGVLTSRITSRSIKYVGTIHALAFRTLGLTKVQVADEKKFADWYGTDVEDVRMALSVYRYSRHRKTDMAIAYTVINPILPFLRTEHLIQSYINWKSGYQYLDFDDMIELATGRVEKFDVLVVDEAQDCTDAQWDFVLSMINPGGTIIIGGDDDQAIFTWAGANPHGMASLAKEKVILDQSWRVPVAVHHIAEATVEQISKRTHKEYRPTIEIGKVEWASYYEPIRYPNRHTVLCRDQWALQAVEDIIIERGIPYTRNGMQSMFDRGRCQLAKAIALEDLVTVKKLSKYLRPEYRETHLRAVEAGWEKAVDFGTWYKEANYLSMMDPTAEPVIHLSTIHGFKGEEDDHVVLVADCTALTESSMDNQEAYDNEVRVWYVGLTRPRHSLTIVGHNFFIKRGE